MSLTPEGFERPRLPEIKADYDRRFSTALGPINTKPDAVIGQVIGIFAEAYDTVMEMLQDNYDSMYPFSAEGAALDGAVSFVGLERLADTETVVTGVAYGVEGTLIPAGAAARADIQYTSTSDVIISRSNVVDFEFEIISIESGAAYQLILGGNTYQYVSSASATRGAILAGLAAAVNPLLFKSEVRGDKVRIYSADFETPFGASIDARLRITKRGSPIVFVATEKGARSLPVGGLSSIDTPVRGWDSVSNLAPGATGRDRETDAELRIRHAASVRATGSATVEAIKARMLQDVPGVTSIQIYENRTNVTTADGIPPHSFQAVVIGGTNSEIAAQLYLTKPAGIETFGNVTISVPDSNGDSQTIRFSRAVPKYIWFRVTVQALNDEETVPIGAAELIKQAIVDYGNKNVGVGDDIIVQRFYGPVFDAVSGLGQLLIESAVTNSLTDTPTYSTNRIVIGKPEGPVFSTLTVTVTGI